MYDLIETDVLVVGGGAAGMRAALRVAERGCRVAVLCKAAVARSGSTPAAGEGLTASFHPEDSPEAHYEDTVRAGTGLADAAMVRALVQDAPEQVRWLTEIGHPLRMTEDGTYVQLKRPGQSHPRNCLNVGGGWGIVRRLLMRAADFPEIRLIQDALALRLVLRSGRVCGVVFFDARSGTIDVVQARATILATGGYGSLWSFSDCPPDVTGDGIVLALEAGATLVDLEMVQSYPTVCVQPPSARGLVIPYESCLNPDVLGGRLVNGKGEEFIDGFPTRDQLTYAICREVEEGRGSPHGGVYFDLLHTKYERDELVERIKRWIPTQSSSLTRMGIDMVEATVEIAPAAHFCCGGIYIDHHCRTAVPGLFAAGECSGNVQGADRLAGNAISEALVFGARAADAAVDSLEMAEPCSPEIADALEREEILVRSLVKPRQGSLSPHRLKEAVRQVMADSCGPRRNGPGLRAGLRALDDLDGQVEDITVHPIRRGCFELLAAYEARAMLRLARCVLLAALHREESRGVHFRTDFPQTRAEPMHTALALGQQGTTVSLIPVRT